MTIEKQIESSGWSLEMVANSPTPWMSEFRAVMGGFCTPWRGTKEQVLEDVRNYKIKPKSDPEAKAFSQSIYNP